MIRGNRVGSNSGSCLVDAVPSLTLIGGRGFIPIDLDAAGLLQHGR